MEKESSRVAKLSSEQRALLEAMLKKRRGAAAASHSRIEPTVRGDSAPLSFAQRRLWFLDQLTPNSSAYNIASAVRLRGACRIDVFEQALSEIVRRHESLRTNFLETEGEPIQSIAPAAPVQIDVRDLERLPEAERLSEALRAAAEESSRPFDLKRDALLRVRILRLGSEDHVVVMVAHHIVSDGWSMGVLVRELAALYEAYSTGRASPLPQPAIQYADYAIWQRRQTEENALGAHLEYWKEHLRDLPPRLSLSSARPASDTGEFQGAKESRTLSKALCEAAGSLGRREGATLFMTLLAAFQVLLARHSGQTDIVVGTPVAGRDREEIENLIGFFINTLVLRCDLSGEPSFREALARVRGAALGAFAHQDLPFERLVEELHPERDVNRTPLFQVFFNLLSFEAPTLPATDFEIEPLALPAPEPKFDLTLYAAENPEGLALTMHYNRALFEPGRVADMLLQFESLLEQATRNADASIDAYSLATERARALLPDPSAPLERGWSGPALERLAGHDAERAAIVGPGGEIWNYGELESLSNRLAHALRARGVARGDVVAIYARRDARLVWAMLGVWKAGAAFLILDAAYPPMRLAERLRAIEPAGWIEMEGESELAPNLAEALKAHVGSCRLRLPPRAQALDRHFLRSARDDATGLAIAPDEPAYAIFTSGTSGEPKAVLGTHRPLSHFLAWHCGEFGLEASDRFSMLSGLSHDPLLRDVLTPLWLGATLAIPAPEQILDPDALRDWMRQSEITVAHLTPSLGAILTERSDSSEGADALPRLRYAFYGGEALKRRDAEALRAIAPGVACVNFYGTTETPQAMGFHRVDAMASGEAEGALVAIGRGIAEAQLLVLGAGNRQAGLGEVGEVGVRSPYLSAGYLGDAALTRERFQINPATGSSDDRIYRTGDLGRYLMNGEVEFLGRRDAQVQVRGYRVEPGEIEAVLRLHSALDGCVVALRDDSAAARGRLVAYLTMRSGEAAPSIASIRAFLRERLPDFMIPAAFVFLDAIPLTPNGKVDLRRLPDPESMNPGADARPYVAPRGEIEEKIAAVWAQVLGVDRVGVADNFFELGGHSLLAARLIARLREVLQTDIPLRALFLDSTVAGLARAIRRDDAEPGDPRQFRAEVPVWDSLVPIQPSGSRIPFFLVAGTSDEERFIRLISNLVPHLGLEQPVYGLKPRGLEGDVEIQGSVEEMARDYVDRIRALQPQGPYLLGGECIGGIVAFEMAQELGRRGEAVGLLMLMDTPRPSKRGNLNSRLSEVRRRIDTIASHFRDVREAGLRDGARLLGRLIARRLGRWFPQDDQSRIESRIEKTQDAYPRLLYRYRPQRYRGKVTLLVNELAHGVDPTMGWSDRSDRPLEILKVPGDHVERILLHARETAAAIDACLSRAQSAARSEPAESPPSPPGP